MLAKSRYITHVLRVVFPTRGLVDDVCTGILRAYCDSFDYAGRYSLFGKELTIGEGLTSEYSRLSLKMAIAGAEMDCAFVKAARRHDVVDADGKHRHGKYFITEGAWGVVRTSCVTCYRMMHAFTIKS
jgi:hypothetical protein